MHFRWAWLLTIAAHPMQVARDKLISLGTCIGKFTHSSKFRLGIGALDLLSEYAKFKASSVDCRKLFKY